MARTAPPEVPRGDLTDQALGLWFTRFKAWAAELQTERQTTADAIAALQGATVTDVDGTDFSFFRHVSGNAGLAAHWNIAGAVAAGGVNTYASPTVNQFYAHPFIAPKRGGTISALAWDSNAALGNSRIAVYSNTADDTLYPNALLGESGSKANTGGATVVSTTGLSIGPLTPGALYWLAYVTDNGSASIRRLDPTSCTGLFGAPLGSVQTPTGIKVAFTFGTPPATFPAGGSYIRSDLTDYGFALGYRL